MQDLLGHVRPQPVLGACGSSNGGRSRAAHLDLWVGVPDGPAIVGHNVGDPPAAKLLALHLAQLVCSLLLLGTGGIIPLCSCGPSRLLSSW